MERVNPDGQRGRPRSEASRQAILEATRALLTEHGFEHLAIHLVAEAAGVGKQTVYRWWPNKAALVATAVLEGFVAVPVLTPDDDDADPRATLLRWFTSLLRLYRQPAMAALMRAMTAASAEDPDVAARLSTHLLQPFRAQIAQYLSPRGLEDRRAAVVAEALIGVLFLRLLDRRVATATADSDDDDIDLLIALVPETLPEHPEVRDAR